MYTERIYKTGIHVICLLRAHGFEWRAAAEHGATNIINFSEMWV